MAGPSSTLPGRSTVRTGAEGLLADDFASLAGLRLGLIVHQASMVGDRHLIDVVGEMPEIELAAVFAPEHGVRSEVDAGVAVADGTDAGSGVPVFSLYGETRQPTPEMLRGIDVLVYDLQDVGVRCYTYISTMGLAMQSAAAAGIPFIVLDRPDPLGGDRLGGFVRDSAQVSFVSQYPIPTVYGLTAGELASAIKGEGWLPGLEDLDLRVIEMQGWSRGTPWPVLDRPWVAPSPGLPTEVAALTYPATVLFEATTLSYGRGTDRVFRWIGAPWLDGNALAADLNRRDLPGVRFDPVSFTPDSALAPEPRFSGIDIDGVEVVVLDLVAFDPVMTGIHLLTAAQSASDAAGTGSIVDRPQMFDLLAGSDRLRRALAASESAEDIIGGWDAELAAYDELRLRYLRYGG